MDCDLIVHHAPVGTVPSLMKIHQLFDSLGCSRPAIDQDAEYPAIRWNRVLYPIFKRPLFTGHKKVRTSS